MKLWAEGPWSSTILKAYLSRSAWSFAISFSNFLNFHSTITCWLTTVSLTFFLNMSTLCLRREKRAAFFWPSAWNVSRFFKDDEWENQVTLNRIHKHGCTHQVRFAWHLVDDLEKIWDHAYYISWVEDQFYSPLIFELTLLAVICDSIVREVYSYELSSTFGIDYENTKPTYIMKGLPLTVDLSEIRRSWPWTW